MPVLSGDQLGELMREIEAYQKAAGAPVNYTKAQLYAAAQAMEDWFEAGRSALSAAINTATSPLVLTAAQKKAIGKAWLRQKFGRE